MPCLKVGDAAVKAPYERLRSEAETSAAGRGLRRRDARSVPFSEALLETEPEVWNDMRGPTFAISMSLKLLVNVSAADGRLDPTYEDILIPEDVIGCWIWL